MKREITLLTLTILVVIGCSKAPIAEENPTDNNARITRTGTPMVEVTIGGEHAAAPATRNSVIYGSPIPGNEFFAWDQGDRVNLFIEGQEGHGSTLDAVNIRGNVTDFHGYVPLMTGLRKIYSVSPDLKIESPERDIIYTFPAVQVQDNRNTQDASLSTIFFARTQYNIPSNGNINDVYLKYKILSSMMRVQVKNGDATKLFRVTSIRLSEIGPEPQLFDRVRFNLAETTPRLRPDHGTATSPKLLKVINAPLISFNEIFDTYILVPPADPRPSPESRFIIDVTVEDQAGNEFTRTLDLVCSQYDFLSSGFAPATRYYATVAVRSANFTSWQYYTKINVAAAGSMSSSEGFSTDIENMKLAGTIGAADFTVMKTQMGVLTTLEMTNVNIIGGAIPDEAFNGKSSLTAIKLPESITRIGVRAFRSTSLSGVLEIPRRVTSIGNLAFANCDKLNATLTLPSALTTIGDNAFYGCAGIVGSLTLPEGLIAIGNGAFNGCTGFTGKLSIPSSVNSIGEAAFAACEGLDGIYFKHTTPIAFQSEMLPAGVPLYVPTTALSAYRSAPGWCDLELNGY